ncbi:MAG: class I SAM-dependent methyltransferase [Vicinamibacterales bacterium]
MSAPLARERCLACDAGPLTGIVSLGTLPLANAYPAADASREEPRFPLDVALCPACSLVQLRHVVPPEDMFSEYLYFSSYSGSMLRHAEALATSLVQGRGLGADSLVVEIASNDGYLLQYFKQQGVPVLGIEPAGNIAAVAERERGIPTLNAFFGRELGTRLAGEGRRADVILGLNVFAHVPDPNGFIAGARAMLEPGGVIVIEAPYVRDMVEKVEFDTIYHEHLSYFSVTAVAALVERHGLVLEDVVRVPIHGGSLRLTIGFGTAHGASAQALLDEERALGMQEAAYYEPFRRAVEGVRADLTRTLAELKAGGATIAGYGAAAKATILLNYCGVDDQLVDFVADRNPHKQGRRMPGCGIPIVDASAIAERRPDYVLLFVWNLADEVLRQEAAYREAGGRFLVAIPKVRVL